MVAKIDTVTARARLKPRREPYWHRISKGCYLGLRKMAADSAGSWIARSRDAATGKQEFNPLGEFGELPDHQRFDAARKQAQGWFDHLGKGGAAGPTTVRAACERYIANQRETKGDTAADDAKARFAAYVLDDPKLAAAELSSLTPAHLEAWRKRLRDKPTRAGERRTDSTLNRDMTCFRAALNLAFVDGLVTSDFAWRGKLRPIKNADRRRELYLDREQRRGLIDKAAPDVAALLRGLALVPLRPGALASLDVSSFDQRLGVLAIGKDKAGRDRRIKLPESTARFFQDHARNKLPTAPLLARGDGKRWDKDAWKGPVKDAARAADLPERTTAYALRHSTITDLVTGGLDLLTVAQLSGTSVRMIEAHYGHLRADHAAAALAALAL